MTKLFTVLFATFLSVSVNAQCSIFSIFSENNDKFTLFIDGEQINEDPSVRVADVKNSNEAVTFVVKFEDESIPELKEIERLVDLDNKHNKITFRITEKKGKFLKFSKGWVSKNEVKKNSFKEKNPFKKITIFKNIKYKWGGKSFKGIDCSALIQVFLNFNNKYCPRDAKDQVRYFKKNVKLSNIKKNDIIYWKGHAALALTNKKLIHAYGPMKKTVIMGINQTIERIEKTANLKVIKIVRL